MPRIVWLFSLVNLVIGSAAFVIGGIVQAMSHDLNVSVGAAGQAMSAYALSTALLAPLALVASSALSRKSSLLLALAIFTAGNTLVALAPSLPLLLLGRVLMGVGAFFTPLAAALVTGMVQPAQRGQALALVFLGISLSYVVGVPLGTWIADAHGWRWAVSAMSAALLACAAVVAWLVPANLSGPPASFKGAGALLKMRSVAPVLLVTLFTFTAIFVVFSYIGAVLQGLVPLSNEKLTLTLSLFGLAGVLGTLLGGQAHDRFGATASRTVGLVVMAVVMLLLPQTAGHWGWMVAVLLVWGIAGFSLMPSQQASLSAAAGPQTPLVLSLNASMLYLGTAAGALVGGVCLAWLSPATLAYAGVPFIGLALLFHAMAARAPVA